MTAANTARLAARTDLIVLTVQAQLRETDAEPPAWCRKELGPRAPARPRQERANSSIAQGRREVEAESVAFLVTVSHGMDPGVYSFPYVASWATETVDVETTLRDTGTRVLQAAHGILDRLDRDNPALVTAAEDAVPFELPTPPRGASVHSVPPAVADRGRHPVLSAANLGVTRPQHGVNR